MPLPPQFRAARALVGLSQAVIAEKAGVSPSMVKRAEGTAKPAAPEEAQRAIARALEAAGVIFIAENGGGAGVRLKFSRREVKAIDTLENEGGPAREDDV